MRGGFSAKENAEDWCKLMADWRQQQANQQQQSQQQMLQQWTAQLQAQAMQQQQLPKEIVSSSTNSRETFCKGEDHQPLPREALHGPIQQREPCHLCG